MLGRADDQRSRRREGGREGRKDRFEQNCGTLIKRERERGRDGTEEVEVVIARGERFERNDSI